MLSNRWAAAAYAAAILLTAATAVFLVRLPFPITESLISLLTLEHMPSATALFVSTMNQQGFMRPASWAASKVVFDLAGGQEFFAFRALHVLMVLALLAGTVRLLRVTSALSWGLALLAMLAIIGMHPFHEAVRETPLNIKLLIPAICVVVLNLSAAGRHAVWRDALALALFTFALLANELGLLVWVGLAAAYLAGFRGVSRPAVIIATILVAAYIGARFTYLDVGAPALTERSSGFGFRSLDPPELIARFGDNPLPFYAYNLAGGTLSILLSEPRSGVFVLGREWISGNVEVGTALNVVTSAATTSLLLWYAARRWRAWLQRAFTHADRLYLVAAAMIAANVVVSYPYLKDVTLSTGAAFYPLAMFAAIHLLVTDTAARVVTLGRAIVTIVLLTVVSAGWTVRAAAFAIDMRHNAVVMQRDWIPAYAWLASQEVPVGAADRAYIDRFRGQMLALPMPSVERDPKWLAELDPH